VRNPDGGSQEPVIGEPVGLVDGSTDATTGRFNVVLSENAVIQLDDLVRVTHLLPDGREVTHYGIVVEGYGRIEGAEFPSDTRRITGQKTMPGESVRRVAIQVLRTVPELWLPPDPGCDVHRATGIHRDQGLFLDQMEKRLAAGLDQGGQPVYVDFSFLNGEKGGHLSISGISGVATKTTYALFLLYMLLETEQGRMLLGPAVTQTRALVFNVKGEDLLHIDRPNRKFVEYQAALDQWHALGVENPRRFERVRLYVPRSASSRPGVLTVDVTSRATSEVTAYGWTPTEFIHQGLLRFCFSDPSDQRTQVSYVEQRVRVQLARWAWPLENEPGAVVLASPPPGTSFNFARVIGQRRDPKKAGEGHVFRDFGDLLDFLTEILVGETGVADPAWSANVAPGTNLAFIRRLAAQTQRMGHLIAAGVEEVKLEEPITVVDIHSLHDDAQRFVVGALLSRIFEEKQGKGREPLRFVLLDELNKYAPKDGSSPIKEVLVDIASRGRSFGVILLGAQQAASDVEASVTRNAAIKVVGRLDASEASEYKFLTAEVRERASRFLPGTMVLDQPLIPAPIPIRFPFPAFATNIAEDPGGDTQEEKETKAREVFERL